MRVRESGNGLHVGVKRGRLTVAGSQWHEKKYWRCVAVCDCGNSGVFLTHCLGKTTYSCGCLTQELQPIRAVKGAKTKKLNGYIAPTPKRNKVCERCFQLYRGRTDHPSRYCSIKCRHPNGKRTHMCAECGIVFSDSRRFAKFCSVDCHNRNQTGPRNELSCQRCERMFVSRIRNGGWPSYCSRECFLDDVRSDEWMLNPKEVCIGDGKRKGEHRLIIESIIGRELEYCGEPVFHLNGNRRDNRIENMFLFPSYSAMGDAFQNGNVPSESNLLWAAEGHDVGR